MIAALQRRGKRARTPPSAVRAVRLLAQFSGPSPHLIAASELQHSLWHRTHVAHPRGPHATCGRPASPAPRLGHASARSRGPSPGHAQREGPGATRHHQAVPPPDPPGPGRCRPAPPYRQARVAVRPTRPALCNASGAASLARSPTRPLAPRTTLQALRAWRTGAAGARLAPCPRGGHHHRLAPACGPRPCPPGQPQQARQWRHHHLHQPLPGPSGLLTLTLPATRRPCCRASPRLASQALGQAAAAARKRRARAARVLGTALPGFPGLLPPWGRPLPSPPHLHALVPGGGRAPERATGWPSRAPGSVPVTALAPRSRALGQAARPPAGLVAQSAPQVWHTPWHVHRQGNPHGATSLPSRAPAVCTVASSHRRLVALQAPRGTVTDRQPGRARPRPTPRDVWECRRRFRPPVLPSGGMQGRHGGLRSASWAINTLDLRRMMAETNDATPEPPATPAAPAPPCSGPHGGGARRVSRRGLPAQEACVETG